MFLFCFLFLFFSSFFYREAKGKPEASLGRKKKKKQLSDAATAVPGASVPGVAAGQSLHPGLVCSGPSAGVAATHGPWLWIKPTKPSAPAGRWFATRLVSSNWCRTLSRLSI